MGESGGSSGQGGTQGAGWGQGHDEEGGGGGGSATRGDVEYDMKVGSESCRVRGDVVKNIYVKNQIN